MTTLSCDVVVGNGIAAHAFLWTYARMLKEHHLDHARRILWIKSPIVPICSHASTSLVSGAGLQRNISPLGDTLLDAYEFFVANMSSFAGVIKARQTHLPHGDLDNFHKRYPNVDSECFVIASDVLMQTLKHQTQNILGEKLVEKIATVQAWEEQYLSLHGGENLKFDRCILALGAGHALLGSAANHRSVTGHYAWTSLDLGEKSWVLSQGPHNLIYRAFDRTLLVGSVDDKGDEPQGWPVSAGRAQAFKQVLEQFGAQIDLPRDLLWQVVSGVRHKGPKRRPFWGQIQRNIWSIHGLYKNGYSLSFLAARQLVDQFMKAQ